MERHYTVPERAISPPIPPDEIAARRAERQAAQLNFAIPTIAELAAMNAADFIEAIATYEELIDELFSFNADVASAISVPRVELISDQMRAEAASLSSTTASRLSNFAYFFWASFFQEFYEEEVTYSQAIFDDVGDALLVLSQSADFLGSGSALAEMRRTWAVAVGNSYSSHLMLTAFEAIFARWLADPALADDILERATVFNVLSSLSLNIGNTYIADGVDSVYYNLITVAFVQSFQPIALDTNYAADAEYVTSQALFIMGQMSVLNSAVSDYCHEQLTVAMDTFPLLSGPWLWAIQSLERNYDATRSDGTPIEVDQIRSDLSDDLLPYTYLYDLGDIVVRTPLNLSTIDDLYDALNEVEAQFFRHATHLDPVEGDTNQTLEMYIYGSRSDYENYQTFLFGLGTDNGGIFIEGDGRFYTYQRTPAESIFTLEELTRHEYVHYLDSRYLIRGGFYETGTLYVDSNIDWYGEALAECFAGSTRLDGVLPRTIQLSALVNPDNRMDLGELVAATYAKDGFGFYAPGGIFFAFLSNDRLEVFTEILETIRGNDAMAVNALWFQLAGDSALDAEYDAYINDRIAEIDSGGGLFAEDRPTNYAPAIPGDNAALLVDYIAAEIGSVAPGFFATLTRFRYQDTMQLSIGGSTFFDLAALRSQVSDILDTALLNLTPQARNSVPENFQAATAWFGDVGLNGVPAIRSSKATATVTWFIETPFSLSSTLVVDHFRMPAVPDQRFGIPFEIQVEARTDLDRLFPGFGDSVDLSAVSGFGSEPVSIGQGDFEWLIPFRSGSESARSQVIYLKDEIGTAGEIEALSLNVSTLPGETYNNWTIRLKHTTLETYPGDGTAQWQNSDWTTVYVNDETISSTGWVRFDFDSPFMYDGVSNLMIDFSYHGTIETSGGDCLNSNGALRSLHGGAVGDNNPLDWIGNAEARTEIPDIRLHGGGTIAIFPMTLAGFQSGVWNGQLTLLDQGTAVRLRVDHLGIRDFSNPFNVLAGVSSAIFWAEY